MGGTVRFFAVLCAVLLIFSSAALGQAVFGGISGTVTDPSGAAVPGAKVTITDMGKGVSYSTSTNDSGYFNQSHLVVGLYEVRIEAPGFDTYVQRNVGVEVDAVTPANARLTVGQVGQVVNVTGELPLLKTERSDVSDTITQKTVQELPVLQRDMSRLYFLVPGVQASGTTAASEQPHDIYRPKIGGQYWGGISFLLDGTDNRDSVLGEPIITPDFDAISELKITTTAYDAEFGQASQAVISMQTKSGTNSLHGSAFWYRRDNNLTARDPFTQRPGVKVPATLWNQFGGSLGGPIQKDKTFIFGDYQGSRQKNGGSVAVRVPTAAERGGDLSQLTGCSSSGTCKTPIYNPCDATGCNGPVGSRQQFAGGVIPTNLLSRQALALLQSIPLPNAPAALPADNNYIGSGSGIVNSESFTIRADRYQTQKLHMFGRYSFLQYTQMAPGAFGFAVGGQNFPTTNFAGTSSLRNQSLAYGMDYSPTPNWVADFRFGFFRYRVLVNPNGLGTSPATDAGIPGLNKDSYYTSGMPAVFVNGGTTGGFFFGYSLNRNNMGNQCNCPLNQQENEFQWVGNVTRTFGNHAIKFGADYRHALNLRVPSDSHRAGELFFDAITTSGSAGGGHSLASFLLGQVQTFSRYVSNSTDAAERQNRFFSYAQDTWRVTRKLTVNYGLRWEIYFPQYVNATGNGGFQNLSTGEVLIAGQNGVGLNGNVNTSLTHFAPRIGVAYQLTPKTVVRMGYGRSYDVGVFGVSFGHNVTQNLPVLANQSVNPAQPWQSVFTLAQGPPSPNDLLATQPKGPTGNPILPNGINPNVLPLSSDNTMRLPTIDAWNLTVERQFSPTLVVSAAYVGNKGEHVTPGGTNYNINQPTVVGFGTLSTDQRRFFYNQACATCPNQRLGWTQSIKYFSDDASVKYNSLQLRAEKRFSNGLSFQGNYTWGSTFDFENSYFFWDHSVGYGRADGVRLHVFNLNHAYELPFGRGHTFLHDVSRPLDYLIGGWQLAGIWTWQSGLPFTPSYLNCGSDRDTGPCKPNRVGPVQTGLTRDVWFTVASAPLTNPARPAIRCPSTPGITSGPWQEPACGKFGTEARNSLFGPNFFNADASLSKRFPITEKLSGQFRAELFNVFNHVNLGQPNAVVDSGTAGKINSLANLTQMRRWQFGLRFDF